MLNSYHKKDSLIGLGVIKLAIQSNKSLTIGCNDPDKMYDRIKAEYPDAKISKHKGYVTVDKR